LETFGHSPDSRKSPHSFAGRSIDQALDRYRPRRTLLLTSAPSDLAGLSAYPVSSLFTVYCGAAANNAQRHDGPPRSLECADHALPFQADSFDLVVAHGLLSCGDEELLDDIQRVLQGGAHLLIMGPGHWGSVNLWRNKLQQPAIHPFTLCQSLRERSFVVEHCAGFGLAGAAVYSGHGLSKPLVAVSDHVLVRARLSKRRTLVSLVRFGHRATVQAGIQALGPASISRPHVACERDEQPREAVA
jgi:SAM-dependent methyltransferase